MPQERPLCFLHIPKTAGTSLTALLRIHWREDAVMPQLQANFHANHPIWLIMARHYSAFGLGMHLDHERILSIAIKLKHLGQRPLLLTVLRDPVERLKSRYREWRGTLPAAYQHASGAVIEAIESAKRLSFEDFILSDNAVIVSQCDNLQTRLLAGLNQSRALNTEAVIEAARQNLSQYHIVGFTEDYQNTVTALSSTYGWTNPDKPSEERRLHQSKAVDGAKMCVANPASIRRLEAYTALDQQLYNFARSRTQNRHQYIARLDGKALYEPRKLRFVPASFKLKTSESAEQVCTVKPGAIITPSQDSPNPHPGLVTLRAIAAQYQPKEIIGLGKKKWPELIGYTADPKHRSDQSLLVLRFHSLNHQMSRIRKELERAQPSRLALSETPKCDYRLYLMFINPMLKGLLFTEGRGENTVLLLNLAAARDQLGEEATLQTINLLAHCYDSHPAKMAQLQDSEPNRLYALSLLSHCNHLQTALDEAKLDPEKTLRFSDFLTVYRTPSSTVVMDSSTVKELPLNALLDKYSALFFALHKTLTQQGAPQLQ
jgi:hypothetical protein